MKMKRNIILLLPLLRLFSNVAIQVFLQSKSCTITSAKSTNAAQYPIQLPILPNNKKNFIMKKVIIYLKIC